MNLGHKKSSISSLEIKLFKNGCVVSAGLADYPWAKRDKLEKKV